MKDLLTLGKFIREKGREQYGSSRKTAEHIGITAMYLCDIERDKKTNPSAEI